MANTIDFGNKTIKNAALDPATVVGVGVPDSANDGGLYARKNAEWVNADAAMPLQVRRGLDSERLQITPAAGEPIYATDTKLLYIGDGTTVGGNLVSVPPDSLAQIPGNPPGMIKGTTIKSSSTLSLTVRSQTGYATAMWWDGTITVAGTGSASANFNLTSPSIPSSGAYAGSSPKTFYVWPSTSAGVQSTDFYISPTRGSLTSGNLTRFFAAGQSLSALDVGGLAALTLLSCSSNSLSSLDVSGLTALTTLYCAANSLSSLDVSGLTALTELDCSVNSLSSLDVSGLTALKALDCSGNSLASLNVSGLAALEYLSCFQNTIVSLDVSGLTALTTLYCNSNSLASLNISGCTALTDLDCQANLLTSLNVSGFTNLTALQCSDNALTLLDVSGCINLQYLYCGSNSLSSLDVSTADPRLLIYLVCNNNVLTSLRAQNRNLVGGWYYSSYSAYGGINARNNLLNAAALNQLYTDLLGNGSGPIVVTNNPGTSDDDPTIATGKNYTVYGS